MEDPVPLVLLSTPPEDNGSPLLSYQQQPTKKLDTSLLDQAKIMMMIVFMMMTANPRRNRPHVVFIRKMRSLSIVEGLEEEEKDEDVEDPIPLVTLSTPPEEHGSPLLSYPQ